MNEFEELDGNGEGEGEGGGGRGGNVDICVSLRFAMDVGAGKA